MNNCSQSLSTNEANIKQGTNNVESAMGLHKEMHFAVNKYYSITKKCPDCYAMNLYTLFIGVETNLNQINIGSEKKYL